MRNVLYRLLLLLLALALAAGMAHAQMYPGAPIRAEIKGYKGNLTRSDTLSVLPKDTANLRAVAMYREGNEPVAALVPTIVRRGLKFVVQWAASPPFTDGWYRVYSGTQALFEGPVHITTTGISLPGNGNATILSGIYSQLGVLQGLYNTLSSGKVNTSTYNAYVSATAQTLATMASDIAGRVLTSDYNTYKAATAISLAAKAPQSALDATNANVASVSASVGANTAAIALASPRIFATYDAARIASLTATVPQTWVVTADETALVNGMPQKQTYWFDGSKLFYPILSPADGSPGTPSFNTAIDNVNAALASKLDVVFSTSSGSTTAAQTGSPKLIIEIIAGTLSLYVYSSTASPTLQKLLTY